MKPLALIMFASALATAAQTPYDSFAPEQAEKAMIELDRSEYSLVNPDSSGTVRCIVISWVDGTYSAFDQAGIAAEGSIDPLDKKFHTMDPKMEEMPQVSPYVYCFANPIGYTDLSGLKPKKEEAARMAAYVYGTNVKLTGDWEPISITGLKIPYGNGLKAQVFQRELKDGKKEYALAFAGTEFDNWEDAKNDLLQVVGQSPQYSDAMDVASKIVSIFEGSEITFVGHSLGGGLSAACAYATGGQAMTFNPAGVSMLTQLPNPKARIDAYVTITDPLYSMQTLMPGLPGVDGTVHFCLPRYPLNGHAIKNFYGPTIGEIINAATQVVEIGWEKWKTTH